MSEFFSFLILGVIQGMTYGILALGLVLIYKGTKTLNFAQPFMGLFTAYVVWYLTGSPGSSNLIVGRGLDTGPGFLQWLEYPLLLFPFEVGTKPRFAIAAIWGLLLIARIGYRLEHDLMRRLENSPRVVNLVVTIALAQGFLGITQILFERTEGQASSPKGLPSLIPESVTFTVGNLPVTSAYVTVLLVVPVIAAGAAAFFRFSRFGVAIRAAAENRDSARLLGISVRRVSSFTWIAGGVLAGMAAILTVPTQGNRLTITALSTGFLVRALAAALIGGLTSLQGAFVGGILVGVAESLTSWQTGTPGVPEVVFFAMVIAVLAFRPGGLFGQAERLADEVAFAPTIRDLPSRLRRNPISKQTRTTAVLVGVMLVSAISLLTGPFTNAVMIDVLIFATAGVSLTLLVGYAGQISLGHFALVGVGAFVAGNLYDLGPIPFPIAILAAVLVGMVVALAIGLPALRIRGPYLAVVTVAFALAASQWIFYWGFVARGTTGMTFTAPDWGWLDLGATSRRPLFFFAFGMFLLCSWVAHNFKESKTGRGFFSLRENEKAAATFGVQLTRYRLLAFMLSGGMAALAGVVFGLNRRSFAAIDFPVEISFILVAMVIIGGLGSITGALLGAFLVFGVPPLLQEALGQAVWVPYVVTFGTGLALIVVITRAQGGLAGLLFRVRNPVVEGMVWEGEQAAERAATAATTFDGDGRSTVSMLDNTRAIGEGEETRAFEGVEVPSDDEDVEGPSEDEDLEVVSSGDGKRSGRKRTRS